MQNVDQLIRDRAYHLWLEGGCQHGQADTHWLEAQREVLSAAVSKAGQAAKRASKVAKSKTAPAARKKKRAA